jgi:hypothetical protein
VKILLRRKEQRTWNCDIDYPEDARKQEVAAHNTYATLAIVCVRIVKTSWKTSILPLPELLTSIETFFVYVFYARASGRPMCVADYQDLDSMRVVVRCFE